MKKRTKLSQKTQFRGSKMSVENSGPGFGLMKSRLIIYISIWLKICCKLISLNCWFKDYQSSLSDIKGPHCRFHTAVPPHVEQISKKLLKLRWDPRDQEPFEGFGPWCLPLGQEPPPVRIKPIDNFSTYVKLQNSQLMSKTIITG